MRSSAGERHEYEIDKLPSKMLNNRVLVRIDDLPEDGYEHTTKSGFTYVKAGSEWAEQAAMARYGTVVMMPDRLVRRRFSNMNSEGMMEWETSIEIEVGDIVYFGIMVSANSPKLIINNIIYYIIPYDRLILRIRGDETTPINGYCLLRKVVEKTRIQGLVLDFGDHQDKRKGIVTHVGERNKSYFGTDAVDAEVLVGDEVVFSGNFFGMLEDEVYAKLPKDTGYVQKCWVIGKLN